MIERTNMSNRVMHFEIHADDPERAKKFYEDVFGWKIKKWEDEEWKDDKDMDYWLIETGPKEEMGINGGLLKRKTPLTGDGIRAYVCTITVKDIDESLKKIKDCGAMKVGEKMEVKKIGMMAYCKDTEGNKFGVMQPYPMEEK